jgi:hypothetical protein
VRIALAPPTRRPGDVARCARTAVNRARRTEPWRALEHSCRPGRRGARAGVELGILNREITHRIPFRFKPRGGQGTVTLGWDAQKSVPKRFGGAHLP